MDRPDLKKLSIGDLVRLNAPPPQGEEHYVRGMVTAHEVYTDGNGTREWWCVRWFDCDGRPAEDEIKHCRHELALEKYAHER